MLNGSEWFRTTFAWAAYWRS